jgi:conjugal transfer mating pair stabilization protein TraN
MRFITKPIAGLLIVCLTHNPIAAVYIMTGLIFFKPFPVYADEFINKAVEGQALGTDLMSGYSVPDVNSSTGQMTLTNGAVAGQTIQQNELFQEIQPGSMDGAAAAYGDSGAFGAQVNSDISSLQTGTSTHAYAYQTLMSSNTSMPNISNDPMWKTSDDIYSLKSPLINDLFSGCDKKTSFSEKSCEIHMEDLKTCKKSLKTESCKVNRVITPLPDHLKPIQKVSVSNSSEVFFNDSLEQVTFQVGEPYNGWGYGDDGCYFESYTLTINVVDTSRLLSAVLTKVVGDGGARVIIDGTSIWDLGGGGCHDIDPWQFSPNINILPYLTAGQHTITFTIFSDDDSTPDGGSYFTVTKKADIQESFTDFPAGCRQRLFDAWPPSNSTAPTFISSGSLNDQASTDWWQCTDAATSRIFGGIVIDSTMMKYLTPILPDPPVTPPAPICYTAETRRPGHISLPCFTDKDGYQICPEYDYNLEEHTSCNELTSNPQCVYVGETCADGGTSPITGACQDFIVTYDCGTNTPASCNQVNEGEKTICDSQIRCMGGECVDQGTESNKDFIRAAAALQVLNKAQQDSNCNPSTGDCALFAGEPMECQMADMSILGQVDCCNMPIQGSWIDYMWLATNTWELADTSVEAYSIAQNGTVLTNMVGSWNLVSTGSVFQAPIGAMTNAWSAITQPFSSMYDSVASMLGEEIGTSLGIEAAKQQVVQWMGEWIASAFGETAASTLLSATTSTAAGITTTTYSMAGSMLSSIITVVGIIYAIYQIAKMVVQLIFACTEEEVKLNMLKEQRLCTRSGEIGNYCSAKTLFGCVARKEAYCCFSSPFARIFQQQARPQLGMSFGTPKAPSCEGISIQKISQINYNKMDFGEWIDMLKISNQIPIDSLTADAMYDKAMVTKGKLPGSKNDNAQDRVNTQTQGSDIDSIRQHLLDNL